MAGTFNCPNCGAPLDYKGSDPIIRCPYCNGSVIVPDNLRSKPAFSSEPHSYTLSGIGDLGGLINQARRLKEVKDLAQTGNFEEAVLLYTEITNASPDAARSSVEALARGLPVTISAHNTSQVTISDQVQSETISKTRPKSKNTSRWIGCSLGCLITGLVMLVLASILIPTLGSLAGVVVGLHPEIVLTAVPNIPAISTTISIPNTPVAESRFAIQEFSFGGEGTGPGLFGDVRAIAVDPALETFMPPITMTGVCRPLTRRENLLHSGLFREKIRISRAWLPDVTVISISPFLARSLSTTLKGNSRTPSHLPTLRTIMNTLRSWQMAV